MNEATTTLTRAGVVWVPLLLEHQARRSQQVFGMVVLGRNIGVGPQRGCRLAVIGVLAATPIRPA